MAKGSGNLRGRTSDASKPYDVSNSFVKRVASRVTELLPQPSSWLSRWMSPSSLPDVNDFASHSLSSTITSRPPATTRADLNLVENVDNHIPAKKARTSTYSSPPSQNKFLKNLHGAEDLSPITVRGEPVAGPSCRSDGPEMVSSTPAQPQNSNKVNGDDCSETSESTSGCSSLVPQAQSTVRSLGGSRYGRIIPPSVNSPNSFQRRGPSFSTTTFSSPLRTSMRERLGSSPFYSGRTMYGGSSQAYLTTAMHLPQRRVGPTVKPVPAQQSLPLSSTAKRILDALEQFSTPVMDAKRMPVVGSKRKLDGSQRYSELSIPTTPDLLRVKRRERLQLSTSAARHSATSAPSPPSPTEYTIRNEEESNRKKQTGKVKTKDKVEEEPGVVVKLPPAVLTVDNLPKIDIAIPPPPPPVEVAASNVPSTHAPTSTKFKFATPTAVSHCESLVLSSTSKTPSFKFSAPICESTCSSVLDSKSSKSVLSFSLPRTSSDNLTGHPTKRKSEDDSSSEMSISLNRENSLLKPSSTTPVRPDTEEKVCKSCQSQTGSLSIPCTCHKTQSKMSTNDKTVSTTSHCICPTCKKEKPSNSVSCTFCQNKSSDSNKNHIKSPGAGFGNLYKKPVGTWECSTCMIQNKNDATKCIACESAKPTQKKTTVTTTTVVTSATVTSGFGNQFQKPSGSWECDTCLIVNKENSIKCISCESPKPGVKLNDCLKSEPSSTVKLTESGFGNMFKKAPGSWSCEVCMVSNSADKVKCVACETVKPGATLPKVSESSVPKFSFGIPSSSSDISTTFSFGIPKGEQSSSSAINLPASTSSPAVTQSAITSETFSFGIPKNSSVSTSGSTHNFAQKMFPKDSASESKLPIVNTKKVVSASSVESAKSELSSLTNTVSTSVPTTNITTVMPALPTFIATNVKSDMSEEKTINTTQMFQFDTNKGAQNSNKPNEMNIISKSSPAFLFGANQGNLGSNVASSTTNTISSSSASNIFKFGDTKTVSSGAGISSISSINTQPSFTTPKPANLFSFGSSSEAKVAFGTNASTEDQQSNKSSITPPEIKPTFGSFNAPQSQTPLFGNNNAFAGGNFGSKDQHQNPFTLSTPNIFGTTDNKNSSTTNSLSGFGQSNTFQAASQESKPSAVYTFGSAPAKETPATGGFVFNPSTEKQAESNFGFTAAQNSTVPPAKFGFNNSTSASSTTFNFEPKPFTGSISPFNAASESTTPVFGATGNQQPTTAFGGQTNSTPVFAFGSQSVQPSQTPTNTVFEFASNQQQQNAPVAAAPSTTFVFGATPAAPAQSPAAPAFDPNIKPTFNFSQGSTPVFSAIPTINSTGPTPPVTRKIRKAVRRTNVSSVRQT